jgi:quercetin dioxygenase-like cupin family protein
VTRDGKADRLDPARAVAIAELVEVAEEATVSRVLARSAGGSLTLFAFAAGQELSEHSAPFDALVQVLEGELELTIDGNGVAARPGEIVLMPADIPHALRAVDDTKMLLTMLRDAGKE